MTQGFSLVRFSPNPEEIEHVNVALLLWGARAPLHYRADFPKLRCVAGDRFPQRLLEEYLEYLGERSRTLDPFKSHLALSEMTAQLKVSRFRFAPEVANEAFVEVLGDRYLTAHNHEERRERARRRPSIESQLEVVLRTILPSVDVYRRPTAEGLLGGLATDLFGNERLQVARAFEGPRGIVLVDALDLDAEKSAIESRAGRLHYAFHRFALARGPLANRRKDLRRVAMFLGEGSSATLRDPTRVWAHGLLDSVSDLILDPEDATSALRQEAENVGALLGPN